MTNTNKIYQTNKEKEGFMIGLEKKNFLLLDISS